MASTATWHHGAEYVVSYATGDPAKAVMRVVSDVQATLEVILASAETSRGLAAA